MIENNLTTLPIAKEKERFFTTQNITKIALLSALSFILYMFLKFPLPFIFPEFLDIQISDMPALLGGFMLGPTAGCVIILIKCLLKLPFSTTFFVGELSDIFIGVAFVLPSALIYKHFRTKKGAVLGLVAGGATAVLVSVVTNAFIIIPAYVQLMFKGSWVPLLSALKVLFPSVTKETFYAFYLPLSVVPFNILRCTLCAVVAFLLYKRVKWLFALSFKKKTKKAIAKG